MILKFLLNNLVTVNSQQSTVNSQQSTVNSQLNNFKLWFKLSLLNKYITITLKNIILVLKKSEYSYLNLLKNSIFSKIYTKQTALWYKEYLEDKDITDKQINEYIEGLI